MAKWTKARKLALLKRALATKAGRRILIELIKEYFGNAK